MAQHGSLNEELNIRDFVIGKTLVQYDFDITAFGHEKGYITGVGAKLYSSNNLIERVHKIFENLIKDDNLNIKIGTIVTGDSFCTDIKLKENPRKEFDADCIEMEAAAIAQVCKLCDIPFIAIKSITDKPNGENQVQFDEYLKVVSKKCAELVEKM